MALKWQELAPTSSLATAMASLWLVNDASTSRLMQQFYNHLANGMTKAEALRQAQLSLLQGEGAIGDDNRTPNGTITSAILVPDCPPQ